MISQEYSHQVRRANNPNCNPIAPRPSQVRRRVRSAAMAASSTRFYNISTTLVISVTRKLNKVILRRLVSTGETLAPSIIVHGKFLQSTLMMGNRYFIDCLGNDETQMVLVTYLRLKMYFGCAFFFWIFTKANISTKCKFSCTSFRATTTTDGGASLIVIVEG